MLGQFMLKEDVLQVTAGQSPYKQPINKGFFEIVLR